MKVYTENIRDLDNKRQGLDFEIQDLLAEMDTEASQTDLIQPKKEKSGDEQDSDEQPPPTKMQQLVNKLVERQKEIEAAQEALKRVYSEH